MTTVNITVTNDADFSRAFQYANNATPPVPIDLTGSTMEMMLRRNAKDDVALLRLGTNTGEIVYSDAVNGLFTVSIAQDVLERLGLGAFDQSLIITRGTSKTKVWGGTFTNNPGPTR